LAFLEDALRQWILPKPNTRRGSGLYGQREGGHRQVHGRQRQTAHPQKPSPGTRKPKPHTAHPQKTKPSHPKTQSALPRQRKHMRHALLTRIGARGAHCPALSQALAPSLFARTYCRGRAENNYAWELGGRWSSEGDRTTWMNVEAARVQTPLVRPPLLCRPRVPGLLHCPAPSPPVGPFQTAPRHRPAQCGKAPSPSGGSLAVEVLNFSTYLW
jgi:hypothetical protein